MSRRLCLAGWVIVTMSTLRPALAAAPSVAFGFDERPAEAARGTLVPGRVGRALQLRGDGGLTIPAGRISLAGGFTIALWLRPDVVDQNTCVASCEDTFLLRLDPPGEGGQLSFFVNAGGSLEPRVRALPLPAGEWAHVVASWDGTTARLWLNGRQFEGGRPGRLNEPTAPILIGVGVTYGGPLHGAIDEVRLYDHALPEGAVLLEALGLPTDPSIGPTTSSAFAFADGAQGFEARGAAAPRVAGGALELTSPGHGGALVRRGLSLPADEARYVALRLAADAGTVGRLVFIGDQAVGCVSFPLLADGRPHSYVLPVGDEAEWDGTIGTLCLFPSDLPAIAKLERLEVVSRPTVPPEARIDAFLPEAAICRAGRPTRFFADLTNTGGPGDGVTARLIVPDGVRIEGGAQRPLGRLDVASKTTVTWDVIAPNPGDLPLRLEVTGNGATPATADWTVALTPSPTARGDYVPAPRPVSTPDRLVGCHYCPLWKQTGRAGVWELIAPFPERKPALGFYDEHNPEVTDWEITWARDHGIDFFVYCWYRRGQTAPVQQMLGHAVHEGLFNARYRDDMDFTIMWENQSRGVAGVASEADFLDTLLPYWIENYFKRDNYVKVDGKPLLFVYRPEFLVDDLGGVANVRRALDLARAKCREAGFDGLWILGEYRGLDPAPLQLMKDLGLDHGFQYCWPVHADPTPERAVATQQEYWRRWREMSPLPYILTASMGWDSTPWHPSHSIWRLPPADFERLCRLARQEMDTLPADSLGRRMILLDNWNEFGEGHYIAPHRQYGFGYLDAVRRGFHGNQDAHEDVVPEDLGLGPYETLYREWLGNAERLTRRVVDPGGDAPGLLAWWSFDEPAEEAFAAWDRTGGGRGGEVKDAARVPGRVGLALDCRGGSVRVPPGCFARPLRALSVTAWLRTDTPNQEDRWFVNSIYGSGESGFRFGLSQGRLSFAIPKTAWSHHTVASEPLPLGRWVHVAGTYDGRTIRVYQDGRLVAEADRGGAVRTASGPLCLANFDPGHQAYYAGLLDEVRIWSRGLSPAEVAAMAKPGTPP